MMGERNFSHAIEEWLAEPPDRGLFVVFEGLDGAGTTTQSALLAEALREHGVNVELTAEPSRGPIGSTVRAALEGRLELDASAMALSFAADRLDHLFNPVNGILNALAGGTWVISDRYVLSSIAYQSTQSLPIEWLVSINSFAVPPDLTVFVDTSVNVCIDRIQRRSARVEEFHDPGKLYKIRKAYKSALTEDIELGALVTADGDMSPEVVRKQIEDGVANALRKQFATSG